MDFAQEVHSVGSVIPAKAGIQVGAWGSDLIPAFAGMTSGNCAPFLCKAPGRRGSFWESARHAQAFGDSSLVRLLKTVRQVHPELLCGKVCAWRADSATGAREATDSTDLPARPLAGTKWIL